VSVPAQQARRELTVAVLACAAGGGLAVWATTRAWAVVTTARPAPLPPVLDTVTGAEHVPVAAALALVGLAGAAALPAARGYVRLLVGLVLLVSGVVVAAGGVSALAGGVALPEAGVAVRNSVGWPALCVAGGVLVAAAGLVATVRGRRWSALGRRYDAPGAEPHGPEEPPMWESLDRGVDPTAR
jgi:hypothetical protein